jgi:3-oxoacyl-[acyl-carrier-protein] synthase II
LQLPISISGIASVSALGTTEDEVWQSYFSWRPLFHKKRFSATDRRTKPVLSGFEVWVSEITREAQEEIFLLQRSNSAYKRLDRSVLLGMLAAKKAFDSSYYTGKQVGINIGSSRGATMLFEEYHEMFLKGYGVSAYTSPTTTLGNLSSWVGQELGVDGVKIGHSVTCSTALHAILNGIAWLQAGMADAFVAGGSEAALTSFTLEQMRSLKLYSNLENALACESMRPQKSKNTMVLGEGAAMMVLEKTISDRTLAIIKGYGYASEVLEHNSSISENGICFQKSMKMALQNAGLETIDVIILHAPGTIKGDSAEFNAIAEIFKNELPLLTSNKWLVGHTFAASGMLSIEMGVLMLRRNHFIENPFFVNQRSQPKEIKTIMVNAVGFGGNAVSIVLSK